MLELVRSTASFFTLPTASDAHRGLVVGLAQTHEELELIQRLRFDVFSSEYGAVLGQNHDGIDRDHFDPWCEHLMVRELGTDRVVGTYRVLTPHQARRAGGYYSESEFDLAGLGAVRDTMVEFGRACIHEDHRQGGVLMMLWSRPGGNSQARQLRACLWLRKRQFARRWQYRSQGLATGARQCALA